MSAPDSNTSTEPWPSRSATPDPEDRARAAASGARGWLLLLIVCGIQFLDAMDIASMGPALPVIGRHFSIGPSELQWVVSGYALGFGGFLLLGGRVADLLPRKPLLIGWLAVFVLAGVAGGLAQSPEVLIAARFVKGVSAAFTAPAAMAVLLDSFREPRARNRALGVFLAVASTGYALGLVFGGLAASLDWRLVLFLPAAAGSVIAVAAVRVLPAGEHRGVTRGRIDAGGALLLTTSVLALVYGLGQAAGPGLRSAGTLVPLAGAAALLSLFAVRERRHRQPLVPPALFAVRGLIRANVAMLMFGTYVGFQFVLTLYYQDVLHWSSLEAGLAFLPGGILTAVLATRGASAVTRWGPWPVAFAGLALLSAGYLAWSLLLGHSGPLVSLAIQQVLGGVGFAAAYPALNVAAVGSAPASQQGLASGLVNASSQVGAGIMISLVATVISAADAGLGGYRAGLYCITVVALLMTVVSALGIKRTTQKTEA